MHPDASARTVCQSAVDQLGDPLFGLTVGSAMAPGSYGMWVHYALQASTLGQGLRRAIRTLYLHQSGAAMSPAPRGRLSGSVGVLASTDRHPLFASILTGSSLL